MGELNRSQLLLVAGVSSLAALTACGSSESAPSAEHSVTASPTDQPSPTLTSKEAYAQAHCDHIEITAESARKFDLRIFGVASVPANYSISVTENPGQKDQRRIVKLIKSSTTAQPEIVGGGVTLPDTTGIKKAVEFEIDAIVTPAGYAGRIATPVACRQSIVFPANSASADSQ